MITDVELRAVLKLAHATMLHKYVDRAMQESGTNSADAPPEVTSIGDVLVRLVSEYRAARDRRECVNEH